MELAGGQVSDLYLRRWSYILGGAGEDCAHRGQWGGPGGMAVD